MTASGDDQQCRPAGVCGPMESITDLSGKGFTMENCDEICREQHQIARDCFSLAGRQCCIHRLARLKPGFDQHMVCALADWRTRHVQDIERQDSGEFLEKREMNLVEVRVEWRRFRRGSVQGNKFCHSDSVS